MTPVGRSFSSSMSVGSLVIARSVSVVIPGGEFSMVVLISGGEFSMVVLLPGGGFSVCTSNKAIQNH